MRILAIGQSVRNIACSAKRAGHEVIAADFYCDLDLEECACQVLPIPLPPEAGRFIDRYIRQSSPDAVVLGPGLETAHVTIAKVLNNPREKILQVSDKLWLSAWLEGRGYPGIPARPLDELNAQRFPAVVKPRRGAGGAGCLKVLEGSGLESQASSEELIVQDWVEGVPASVSLICDGREAVAISINEQLIGEAWTGAKGLRYSGNITPLVADKSTKEEMVRLAEGIASDLGLTGSNGIDFILSENGPVVVEVNPRFQGSLDAVELSTGMNIFQAHLESFRGILPDKAGIKALSRPLRTAGRAIVYAGREIRIDKDLRCCAECLADVPRVGSVIEKDEPIASILASGSSRGDVMAVLRDRASRLIQILTVI